MITVFNRRELAITYKVDELARIRQILEANKIDYRLRTVGQIGTAPMSMGRARSIPVSSMNTMHEYILYVHRDDLEYATHLIRR